jgi:replicative DNA helicase
MKTEELAELSEEEKKRLEELNSSEERNTKFGWDENFQSMIVGLLLTDKFFLVQSLDKIQPDYFTKEAHILIIRILFNYFEKYKDLPPSWFVKQEIKESLKEKKEEIKLYYEAEYDNIVDFMVPGIESRQALTDKITFFAKVQSLKITFHKCLEKMARDPESDKTWSYIYDQIRQTMTVDKNYDTGLEYFENIEEMFERMKRNIQTNEIFTSGFPSIDGSLTGGGLLRGNIGAWIGLPGSGKSLVMCKAAVENVRLGKKVLYITMEMDELGIAQRFTSQYFEKDIKNLMGSRKQIIEEVEEFKKDKLDPNMFIVKQFPGGTMDVNGIRAYYSQMVMKGFKPDLLIIDYVGEMKDDPNVQKYESAYRILRDLRAFGIEQNHCTITCVQPNQSASKLDISQYIDESNIGTSFDQYKPLDCFWSINQQVNEKDAEVGRAFIIKHRNGKSRTPFKIGFNYEMGTLDVYEITDEAYRQKLNLVDSKRKNEIMNNKDSITKDSNSKKKQRSRSGFIASDEDDDHLPINDVIGD